MAKKNRNNKRVNRTPQELMERAHIQSLQRKDTNLDLSSWDDDFSDSVSPIPAREPVELLQPEQPKSVQESSTVSKKAPVKPSKRKSAEALLLTVTDLCCLLNCSRSTIVRMQERGELPGRVYIGSAVRYHRETIETWLREMVISKN